MRVAFYCPRPRPRFTVAWNSSGVLKQRSGESCRRLPRAHGREGKHNAEAKARSALGPRAAEVTADVSLETLVDSLLSEQDHTANAAPEL